MIRLHAINHMADHSDRFQYTERDLLIQLRTDFKAFAEQVRQNQVSLQAQHNDHEARLRVLENFRWWIIGASAAAGFSGTLLARLILH